MDAHTQGLRLVCVQGTAQLLTATAALRYHDSQAPGAEPCNDVLLIYNLACPSESERAFIECIESLATSLHSWAKVVSIGSTEFESIAGCEHADAVREIQRAVGGTTATAVFMARDCGHGDALVAASIRTQCRICYGDGIGFYAPVDYLQPKELRRPFIGYRKLLRQRLASLVDSCRPTNRSLFDKGYFVASSAVGFSPRFPTSQVPRDFVLGTYQTGVAALPSKLVSDLAAKIPGDRVSCLLTSTNSEWGRISEENELEAYRQWLSSDARDDDSTLLLKSHPRESASKVRKIVSALESIGCNVVFPDPTHYGQYPAELLLMELTSSLQVNLHRVYTVSAAALGIAYLFDCEICVGFGSEVSQRWFSQNYADTQIRQEVAARRSVAALRSER